MTANNILVIGGGIGGLTAATYLARAGVQVRLVDKAKHLGGRARTTARDGFRFNLGPHALYAAGVGMRVLTELGIAFTGEKVDGKGGYAVRGDHLHTLPMGLFSLLSTGLLRASEKLQLGRILGRLPGCVTAELAAMSYRDWVHSATKAQVLRELLFAIARVATYSHAPHQISAGATIAQMNLATRGGVWYLDSGWQTLVDGLRDVAEAAGVRFETGVRIDSLRDPSARADAVVIATDPATAANLLGRPFDRLLPAAAACLDVGLRRLPRERATFALGIDQPLYYSVHTRHANLAPRSGAVVHVAEYLDTTRTDNAGGDRTRLESLLDRLQPGWRDEIVYQRFMPRLTVSHGMPTCAGRPGVIAGDNVFLAGDWVGDEGMLADTAFASGRRAARALLAQRDGQESVAA